MQLKVLAKVSLCNTDGTMLAIWRSKTDPNRPGEIDIPGGNVDESEDFAAAVVRETKEEVGIELRHNEVDLVYAFTKVHEEEQKIIVRLFYVAKVANPEVRLSDEHFAFKWLPIDDVVTEFADSGYRPAIEFALKHDLLPI